MIISIYKEKAMVVVSVRMKKIRTVMYISIALVTVALFILAFIKWQESKKTEVYVPILNEADGAAFLTDYGFEADVGKAMIEEVKIPVKFDGTYEAYNEVQKMQGFDLNEYKGEDAIKYVYELKSENGEACVLATLLVKDEKLIGCDVYLTKNEVMLPVMSTLR